MSVSPLRPHEATPAELRERIDAERRELPFLVYRDADASQHVMMLTGDRVRLAVGRGADCDVCLYWDDQVSRLHAELVRVGSEWVIVDDGLSRNGTSVCGERVVGRRRLLDGDVVQIGDTTIAFRRPVAAGVGTTRVSDEHEVVAQVTVAQRRVLVALCRPFKLDAHAVAATNPQIAAELFLTVAAVKSHLRALFLAFGINELPQQEKRRRLVALAFQSGLITDREL